MDAHTPEQALRREAIRRRLQGERPGDICRDLYRSDTWLAKWWTLYQRQPQTDFADRSRAPHPCPHQTLPGGRARSPHAAADSRRWSESYASLRLVRAAGDPCRPRAAGPHALAFTGYGIEMQTTRLPFQAATAIVVPMAYGIEWRPLWATSPSSRNSAARSRRTPPRPGAQPKQSPSKTATAAPSSPWRRARSSSPDGRCLGYGNHYSFLGPFC
jgi:transposase-like protein